MVIIAFLILYIIILSNLNHFIIFKTFLNWSTQSISFFVKLKLVWHPGPFVCIKIISTSIAAWISLSTVPTYFILFPNRIFTYQFDPFCEIPLYLLPRGASPLFFLLGQDFITISSDSSVLRLENRSFRSFFCSFVNSFSTVLYKLLYFKLLFSLTRVLSRMRGFRNFSMYYFLTECFDILIWDLRAT